ncbi:MAG: type III-B CRISPR-associated protein Cas10/Cmr2 [Candidatus Eisenbacteria bacterium]|nr:type III-B CRISPR-associated protein Cas10/Cmr2 [Candidatus Eisenbacteria bacterium]
MTASSPPDPWAHKAHALLLPTPLANIDPNGEDARATEVRDLLKRHDLGVADWTPTLKVLHAEAHRDAYDAHIPRANASGKASLGLRHPLSLEPLPGPSRTLRVDDWPDFLRHLDKILGEVDLANPEQRYTRLWRHLMGQDERFGLAAIPGDPIFNDHNLLAHRSAAAALVGARLTGSRAALLHLHIGPVQGFIKAARRTHDLALGSYTVAYLSFHAIKKMAERCGPDAILYPDLATLPLYSAALDPLPARGDARRNRALEALRASLPNRFMAIVPEDQAEAIAEAAARAAFGTWQDMANAVRAELTADTNKLQFPPELKATTHWSAFAPQIDDHLEIDAAIHIWPSDQPQPNNEPIYTRLFKNVRDDLTAQRRLVTALPRPGTAVPKCTQCGEREQIGSAPPFWPALRKHLDDRFSRTKTGDERETLDLRDGEALCAVCLTKRFANRWYFGKRDGGSLLQLDWQDESRTDRLLLRFPSVASIASAPVRYALAHSAADPSIWNEALIAVHKHEDLDFTPPGNLLPALDGPRRTGKNHLDVDGTWFYETSYNPDTALRDHDSTADPGERTEKAKGLKEPLRNASDALRALLKDLARSTKLPTGEQPSSVHVTPYYAVLNLDVDRMGKWLDGTHEDSPKLRDITTSLPNADQKRGIFPALHREISRRQSKLASSPIYDIVERQHLGRVVYSGGDDLLAFLPLATLFRCLTALHDLFRAPEALGSKVTLSAGIAITHWRAPLSQALELSREAEEKAKLTRDRLVVTVDTRSGAPLTAPLPWAHLSDLHDLDRLAPLTADRPEGDTGDSAPFRLRFNTLEALESELDALLPDHETPPIPPLEAVRARLYLHLTGRRTLAPPNTEPLLRQIEAILTRESKPDEPKIKPKHRRRDLLHYLHLLRFLAREHDPVLAAHLPSPGKDA